jgi:4-amino-4-deoxy-L-arabinose transferase-like glycosyltransferase
MVARDFARHGFRLLYPQVQWVSNGPDHPSYFSGEFSIEGLLAALLYTVLGEAEVSARIVVITFSLLGIYFLYELLRRRAGPIAARLGAFIYAMLPYHLFFGRVFMPDVPALSLALGGLCFLDRWTENRKAATLFAAAALTSMAILQKLTVIVVGLPALYLFWLAQGRYLFVRRELYLFVAIVAAPSFAWYTHTNAMARFSGFAFVQPEMLGSHLVSNRLSPSDACSAVVGSFLADWARPVSFGFFLARPHPSILDFSFVGNWGRIPSVVDSRFAFRELLLLFAPAARRCRARRSGGGEVSSQSDRVSGPGGYPDDLRARGNSLCASSFSG